MRRLLVAALLLAASWQADAMTPEELLRRGHVRVRVSTEPSRSVVIGQQTRFFVDILTDTWFTKAPAYPELNIAGAITLMPEQLGTNFTERIDGTTFAAQRRSYVIFPERAGRLEIPSLRIRLAVAEDAKAGTPFTLSTRPLHLRVILPAEAEGLEGLVTTPRLRVNDEWSRHASELRVGDALERKVTIEADQALGMLLPDLVFEAPPGVAVYADQPRVIDRIHRGKYEGERVESATYVLQRPGEYTLPGITIHWWHPEWGALQTERLEARVLEVTGKPAAVPNGAAESFPSSWWARTGELRRWIRSHRGSLFVAILAVVLGMQLARRSFPDALRRWREARETRRESEAQLFRTLERSARRGDPDAIVRNFWRWRDRLSAELPSLTDEIERRAAEASGFRESWGRLGHSRYGNAKGSLGRMDLSSPLLAYRAALLSGGRSPSRPRDFPRLNP